MWATEEEMGTSIGFVGISGKACTFSLFRSVGNSVLIDKNQCHAIGFKGGMMSSMSREVQSPGRSLRIC